MRSNPVAAEHMPELQTRIDRAEIRGHRTAQGYLRADAWLTRSGVFIYENPDGSTRREYRPSSEVFDAASLDTLQLVALTDEHPPALLDSANTRQYQIGKVGERIDHEGRWVRATVQVDDDAAQRKVADGKVELSAGYTVQFDATPGVTPDGLPYDGVQRRIRYNHLSLVERGRASEGSEKAALKLDAAIQKSEVTEGSAPPRIDKAKGETVLKVKINGDKFEVDQDLYDAIQAERSTVSEKLDAEKARADAAEEKSAEAQAKLDAAPEKLDERVKARVKLEREAAEVLDSADVSEKTDAEIQRAVVEKLCPQANLDNASDVYLKARYDMALEAKQAEAEKNTRATADAAATSGPSSHDEAIAKARADFIKSNYSKNKGDE